MVPQRCGDFYSNFLEEVQKMVKPDLSVELVVGWRNKPSDTRSRDERSVHKPDGAKVVTLGTGRQKKKAAVVPAVVDMGSIRWEARSGKYYVTADCLQLKRALRKRMCNPRQGSSHLYTDMLKGLQDPKFVGYVQFHMVAAGFSPGQNKKEPSAFIKLEGKGSEFPLPRSFLKDCNVAFTSNNFPWR